MIHDLTDLEPLLHRYEHEKVLVGPLLNLWTNSSFRVFNIAGKSSKIHETIGLGFFEFEKDAQRRRADIVAALKDRFGEVEIFDSQLEMAQMAHTLWANDETVRFLATVLWESKPQPTRETSQNQNFADSNKVTALADVQNNDSGDYEATVAVAPPDPIDLGPAPAAQCAGDHAQQTADNRSNTDTFANPETLAESGSNLETVTNLPAAVVGSSVSKKYRLWALSVAYLALCFVVGFLIGRMIFDRFISMGQTTNEVEFSRNAAASITTGDGPSEVTETINHAIPASPVGSADPQPREAIASPSSLTAQPAVADGGADTASFRGVPPSQNPSGQAEAASDEQLSQSPKAQGNQADDSVSPPQSSPPQTVSTPSSGAETIPLSIPQSTEVVLTKASVSPASTQILAGHGEPQFSPGDAATPKDTEASSTAPQQQAFNSAIVPLPRPRPVISAGSSDRTRRRIAPMGQGARNPLLSLFGH